jgi:hypothetical protein
MIKRPKAGTRVSARFLAWLPESPVKRIRYHCSHRWAGRYLRPASAPCTQVCSAVALDKFFSMLPSSRFGSADALLDITGRFQHDKYINDEHVRTQDNPSD